MSSNVQFLINLKKCKRNTNYRIVHFSNVHWSTQSITYRHLFSVKMLMSGIAGKKAPIKRSSHSRSNAACCCSLKIKNQLHYTIKQLRRIHRLNGGATYSSHLILFMYRDAHDGASTFCETSASLLLLSTSRLSISPFSYFLRCSAQFWDFNLI